MYVYIYSPVIVDDTADLEQAARRIIWGRFVLNCGQICLAPEYVLCDRNTQNKLVDALKRCIKDYFGDEPMKNKDYGRIINKNHFNRVLQQFLFLCLISVSYEKTLQMNKLHDIDPILNHQHHQMVNHHKYVE